MRLVHLRDGALEIRWTWLPYWLAMNPKLKLVIEREMRDACLLQGMTTAEADLDDLHSFVVRRLRSLFPAFVGLETYLDAIQSIQEPPRAA